MRKFILAMLASTALAASAQAGDIMAVAYGNTINVVNNQGAPVVNVWINEDKSWEAQNPDGSVHKGNWMADDKQVCFTRIEPPLEPNDPPQECHPFAADHKVGDVWTEGEGEDLVKITIVQGR